MPILPRPEHGDRPPPVVEWLRRSRLYARIQRHRSLAAALTALPVAGRLWRVVLVDPLLALALCAAAFAGAFVVARLGLDWLDRRVAPEGDERSALGPSWAARPPDRATTHVPPRMG